MTQRFVSSGNVAGRRSALTLLVVGAALFAPAPARAAEGEYGPVEVRKNEASLMKTVTEYEELFQRRGYRYGDAEVEGFVGRIGARLAPPPTDPYIRYRFHVLRDPEPNAFALPDGQVYFNTGLLAALENEAQVAAILAHEVNHTAGHHGILEYRSVRAKLVSSMVLGPLTLGLSDVFLSLSIFGYSRDLEAEADRNGARKMFEAGYDPRTMGRVFEILKEDPEDEKPKRATSWSSHPDLEARTASSRALAGELLAGADGAALKVEAAEYRRLARRLSLETVQDLIAADYPRSAVVLSRRLLAENESDAARHLAVGEATCALGARPAKGGEQQATDEEKRRNLKERVKLTRAEREEARLSTPEGRETLRRNMEAARQSYARALELDPGLAEAHRGIGLALMRLDDAAGAGKELVAYLRARPDAIDKPVILGHLKDLTGKIKKGAPADEKQPSQ